MCRTLCVSRSRYYAWKRRAKSFRQQENERLIEKIREAHKLSRRAYGSPRIAKKLKENNIFCGKNRVARLMRLEGIYAKTKRRFRVSTHSDHKLPVPENLINRRFKTDLPNKAWLSDITHIRIEEGCLYLSAVLGLYNRQIIRWSKEDMLTQNPDSNNHSKNCLSFKRKAAMGNKS
jgi:putative transposase